MIHRFIPDLIRFYNRKEGKEMKNLRLLFNCFIIEKYFQLSFVFEYKCKRVMLFVTHSYVLVALNRISVLKWLIDFHTVKRWVLNSLLY